MRRNQTQPKSHLENTDESFCNDNLKKEGVACSAIAAGSITGSLLGYISPLGNPVLCGLAGTAVGATLGGGLSLLGFFYCQSTRDEKEELIPLLEQEHSYVAPTMSKSGK